MNPKRARSLALVLAVTCVAVMALSFLPGTRAQDDAQDAPKLGGTWIYEDLEAAYAQAKATGKPLLVGFR